MNELVTFLVIIALQCASSSVIPELNLLRDGETERIVQGKDAREDQFPWAAALYMNDRFLCTASIIGEDSVLTAAHCVVDSNTNRKQDPEAFYAIANVNRTASNARITFRELYVHPEYKNLKNDIAVFRTHQRPISGDNVSPVCLARADTPMYEYKNATAMGWGNTRRQPFKPKIPETLQHVNQTIVLNSICQFVFPGIARTEICATGPFNGVCNGDSGGPLVHFGSGKKPVQIGVTSYGNIFFGCGKLAPAVWTRVSSYANFIHDSTAGDEICWI